MGIFSRRDRPLSSRHGSKEPSTAARGCLSAFLIVWGLGFAGGGVAVLLSEAGPGDLSGWLRVLFAAPFVLGGLAAIVFGFAIALGMPLRRGRRDAAAEQAALLGPRTLRPTRRAGCVLFFLAPFTAIWVTIVVGIFVKTGDPDGPPWFFAVVFGAATLGLCAFTGYQLLALTNPRAEIDLEVDEVGIGDLVEVPWRLVGSTSRLGSLTIALVGREEASYTRGTDRVTDRHDFFERVLLRSEDVVTTPRGQLELRVPKDGVPSFESDSNKIAWLLRFSSPIRRWPDVADEIALPVGPGSSSARRTS